MGEHTKTTYKSRDVARLLQQGMQFLRGICSHAVIREALRKAGYTSEEHQRGIALFSALMGFGAEESTVEPPQNKAFQAISDLDAWDDPNFAKAQAALKARYPEQEAYIFKGLEAKKGVGAIWSVQTYVDRISALRSGSDPKRKGTKKADAEAVSYLETRHLAGEAVESLLRGWLQDAKTFETSTPKEEAPAEETKPSKKEKKKSKEAAKTSEIEEAPVDIDDDSPQIQSDAEAFDLWLNDWRTTAKIEIKRREYRISLGLVARRKAKKSKDKTDENEEGDESDTSEDEDTEDKG